MYDQLVSLSIRRILQSPLTIVIPVYNRARIISRTLQCIDNQSVQPARVILVDNNSTDNTLAVLSSWTEGRDYVTVLTEPKAGACAARNRGLREVSTSWTMFFDSDDLMSPTHVEDFTRAIARNPSADIIGRNINARFIDGRSRRLYFKGGSNAMFHHLFRGSLSTQRFVARTELFRIVGGWDETLGGWDDYELGVRLLLQNPHVLQLSGAPTVTAVQQSESITGTSFTAHPERWEDSLSVIRRHFTSLSDTNPLKRRYLAWLDARCMILAAQYELERRRFAAQRQSVLAAQAGELSRRLRQSTLATAAAPRRQQLVYLHNLHLHRLTWLLAKTIL